MHSHIGDDSLPELQGSDDTNSYKGIAQPWLRSLDGLNSHDMSYRLSVSGGVTTALVLPGSADAIGSRRINVRRTQSNSIHRWPSFPDQIEAHKGTICIVNVAGTALQYGHNAQGSVCSSCVATDEVRTVIALCKHDLIYTLRHACGSCIHLNFCLFLF